MKFQIEEFIRSVLPRDFERSISVSAPDVRSHGDYSTNVAFALAKRGESVDFPQEKPGIGS